MCIQLLYMQEDCKGIENRVNGLFGDRNREMGCVGVSCVRERAWASKDGLSLYSSYHPRSHFSLTPHYHNHCIVHHIPTYPPTNHTHMLLSLTGNGGLANMQ